MRLLPLRPAIRMAVGLAIDTDRLQPTFACQGFAGRRQAWLHSLDSQLYFGQSAARTVSPLEGTQSFAVSFVA